MNVRDLLILLCVVVAGNGCQENPPILAPKTAHGGMLFDLPEGQGSVEVVRQATGDSSGLCRLTLYYLNAEGQPMTPSPTAATLKTRGREAGLVEFKPGSPTGSLESPNLPDQGDIGGELTTTIGGKTMAISVNIR